MLTIEERMDRDGKAWRYVYGLEREIKLRRTRSTLLRVSLALNALAAAAIFALLV